MIRVIVNLSDTMYNPCIEIELQSARFTAINTPRYRRLYTQFE